MNFLADLSAMLCFRTPALLRQAQRRMPARGVACFSAGFLAYALVRNRVYAGLPGIATQPSGPLQHLVHFNLLPSLVFALAIYVPALVLLGGLTAGKRGARSAFQGEYSRHVSALMPLWGLLFLAAAPLQWAAPHFLVLGMLEISLGYLIRTVAAAVYTVWAVMRLNRLTAAQASGAFVLSWITLPALYAIVAHPCLTAACALIPVVFWGCRRLGGIRAGRRRST